MGYLQLPTKRRALWRYGGLGADDPMIFCCPGDTIRHPASYCKTVVCEKPLSRALPGRDAEEMMYCCPGDTVMRPKSRCRLVECAGAPSPAATPAAAPVPAMTPPVTMLPPTEDYYRIQPYEADPELEARRLALETRKADLEARMAELRAQAPLPPGRALGRKAPPALSISAPKDNTLLIAAAIGGGLLLLSYLREKK